MLVHKILAQQGAGLVFVVKQYEHVKQTFYENQRPTA